MSKKADLKKARISQYNGGYIIRTDHENGFFIYAPYDDDFIEWVYSEEDFKNEEILFESSEIYYLIDEIVQCGLELGAIYRDEREEITSRVQTHICEIIFTSEYFTKTTKI
jgi:hypothetical protein